MNFHREPHSRRFFETKYTDHRRFRSTTRFDNPLPTRRFPYRQLSCLHLWWLNLWQLVCPAQLSCDWSARSIAMVSRLLHVRTAASLSALVALPLLMARLADRRLVFVS